MKKNKKGFTLIELIAVLVILAMLALIVTPLILNIIKKARVSADKRSIDAYGRSVELSIANYLLDHGTFPTSISQVTIEYRGDEVVCNTTQLNSDSSIYLTGCTVAGRTVDYTYGEDRSWESYSVGDEVSYNNVSYRVLKTSRASESTITLIKSEPITSKEISPYLSSTEVASKVNVTGNYAFMAYYSGENCVSSGDVSGCSTDYTVSDVKQVVDIWKTNYASDASEARLITIDEVENNLRYEYNEDTSPIYNTTASTPSWAYSINYVYLTMSSYNSSESKVWVVSDTSHEAGVPTNLFSVRPVIVLNKALID